jgi:hypothetical protein
MSKYTETCPQVPDSLVQNGTLTVNTTAIRSTPNCHGTDVPVNMYKDPAANGTWHNSAVYKGCNFTWSVNKVAKDLFGLDVLGNTNASSSVSFGDGCAQFRDTPVEHQPIALWFFTYRTQPNPSSSIAFCEPSIDLWRVRAEVDLTARNLTNVDIIGSLSSSDMGGGLSGNITGTPLNGQAYNGAAFDPNQLAQADPFVLSRATATNLQLPAAVMQAARLDPAGFEAAFATQKFVDLSNSVYVSFYSSAGRQDADDLGSENVPASLRPDGLFPPKGR